MKRTYRFMKSIVAFMSKPNMFLLITCLLVTVLGPIYVYSRWTTATADITGQAVETAQIAAVSINGSALGQLRGVAEDLGTPAYVDIKQRLLDMVKVEPDARFAYCYTVRDGKVYIMADSETPDSGDYSPPGQEYTEASHFYIEAYDTGKVIVSDLVTDRWGTWVSILVPVIEKGSYETVGVFGMDYPADKWYSTSADHALQAALYVLGMYIILIGTYIIMKKNEKERKSQRVIQENEKKYHLLSDVTLEGIAIHQNSRIKDINPSFARMFGYDEEEIFKMNGLDLFYADDRDLIQKNIENRSESPYEARGVRKNGEIFYLEIEGRAFQTQEGTLRVSSVRDITERKEAAAAITKNVELYHSILNASPDVITITDMDGRVLMTSPISVKMFGYDTVEDQIGLLLTDYLVPEDRKRAETVFSDMIEGVPHNAVEYRGLRKDGSAFDIETTSEFIRNEQGQPTGMVIITRDISKRKQDEEALRSSELRLRAITDSAQDAIIMMDPEGGISFWNPASERIFGYSAQEAIGQRLHKFIVPSRYYDFHMSAFPNYQKTGQGAAMGKTLIMEALRKDGTEIYVQLSLSAVPMKNGWHAVGILRDVSLQKRAEEELKKAKTEAEEAANAKSDFLANMSHEIRTPMNAIIGFSNLVLKTDLTPKQKNYIGKIDSSANSLLTILNDILDFSKIEAGKLEMETVDFSLEEVISNIIGMISIKAAEKNLELLSTIEKDVPVHLVGDPMRLGQILINLVNNAVKFTDKGHILVRVELVEKEEESCRLKFTVSDTGIGMTEEQVGKMFVAFSQADSSITRKYGGTGLGLTISKRLVGMMDGDIGVDSEFGVGSKFFFTAKFKSSKNEKEHQVFNLDKFKNLRVLIVDDNEMAREVLKEQIADLGMSAVAAGSGEEAIAELERAAEKTPYDLVLIDWRMPGMDGLETAKTIFRDKKLTHTPLTIMVSAFGREEVFQKAKKIGINAFLIKPISQSLLLDTIMEVFGMNRRDSISQNGSQPSRPEFLNGIGGSRLLLVEDNLLNQEVANEILKSLDVIVEIADNGQEAVKTVELKGPSYYDAVLMDIQMPVMGGYEATRLLRGQAKFKDLPIIAMTAHAMQGVKEECLAAGMNDYVSKPIDPIQLLSTIEKWLKPDRKMISPKEPEAENPPKNKDTQVNGKEEQAAVLLPEGIPGIDTVTGLRRLDGNRRLYRKLLEDFTKTYARSADEIREILAQGDIQTALRLTHMLKGVGGNISLEDIRNSAIELEMAISTKQEKLYDSLIQQLDTAIQSIVQAMEKLVPEKAGGSEKKEETPAKNVPVDLSAIGPVLQELALLVWEDDVDARDVAEKLQVLLAGSDFAEDAGMLTSRIESYDFETAKDSLQKIAKALGISIEGVE